MFLASLVSSKGKSYVSPCPHCTLNPAMSTKQVRLIANFKKIISRKHQPILRNTRQGRLGRCICLSRSGGGLKKFEIEGAT